MLKVTRNLVVDRVRSAATRYETVTKVTHDVTQPDSTETVLASLEFTRLLGSLSSEHREVLAPTYLYGRTDQETAEILGVPAGTVRSRKHYALVKLRAQ
ncbi:RNA polymerase subunit sigma [Streptomyces yokosukanensis]|uniref:RNA polymerase subunit sigma n=1 Tax=Streptomyces yokosukanensis TaxID=67386 RepID=A0A101NUG7_9ACTN|nr:RNA polymerase subunit sigma [Streptomyces yokosukanensis]